MANPELHIDCYESNFVIKRPRAWRCDYHASKIFTKEKVCKHSILGKNDYFETNLLLCGCQTYFG